MRDYAPYVREAVLLMSRQIRLGRKQRRWSEQQLASRAGISRATLQKIEKGELGVAIGTVFEVAALVGVPLFASAPEALSTHIAHNEVQLALMPRSVRQRARSLDDEF